MKQVQSFVAAVGLAATVLLSAVPVAQAIPLVRTSSFWIVNGLVPVVGVPAFDPALGTLDRVHVSISGAFTFELELPAGGTITPILEMEFIRLGPSGFNANAPKIVYATQSNPTQTPSRVTFQSNFFFDATFNALTDLIGGAVIPTLSISGAASGPVLGGAFRADFIEHVSMLPVMEVMRLQPSNFMLAMPISGAGGLIVTYDYTPPPPPPDPVAEPLSLALFGLGLAALGFAVRRKRR